MECFRTTVKWIGMIGMTLTLCVGCGGGSSSTEAPLDPISGSLITPQSQPAGGNPGPVLPNGGSPISPPPADPVPPPNPTRVVLPVQAPLFDKALVGSAMDEGWLGSPAVVDLDGDGVPEIIAARTRTLYVWHADGTIFL